MSNEPLDRHAKLLLRYVDHLRGCTSYTNGPCTCGFENAMQDLTTKTDRSVLSSRDTEVREVLEGLSWSTDVGDGEVIMHWCNEDRSCDEACDATRALYAKVQPKGK